MGLCRDDATDSRKSAVWQHGARDLSGFSGRKKRANRKPKTNTPEKQHTRETTHPRNKRKGSLAEIFLAREISRNFSGNFPKFSSHGNFPCPGGQSFPPIFSRQAMRDCRTLVARSRTLVFGRLWADWTGPVCPQSGPVCLKRTSLPPKRTTVQSAPKASGRSSRLREQGGRSRPRTPPRKSRYWPCGVSGFMGFSTDTAARRGVTSGRRKAQQAPTSGTRRAQQAPNPAPKIGPSKAPARPYGVLGFTMGFFLRMFAPPKSRYWPYGVSGFMGPVSDSRWRHPPRWVATRRRPVRRDSGSGHGRIGQTPSRSSLLARLRVDRHYWPDSESIVMIGQTPSRSSRSPRPFKSIASERTPPCPITTVGRALSSPRLILAKRRHDGEELFALRALRLEAMKSQGVCLVVAALRLEAMFLEGRACSLLVSLLVMMRRGNDRTRGPGPGIICYYNRMICYYNYYSNYNTPQTRGPGPRPRLHDCPCGCGERLPQLLYIIIAFYYVIIAVIIYFHCVLLCDCRSHCTLLCDYCSRLPR